jgi:hypothetical protein
MCIRRVAISATPPAPDDTSFEEDTASVTQTGITLPGWQWRRDGIWHFPGRVARVQAGISACFAWFRLVSPGSAMESELVQAADGERDDEHGQRYGGDSDEDAENIGHRWPALAVVTAQRASVYNSRPLKTSLRGGCG